MRLLIRHLLSIAALPFVVTVVVPGEALVLLSQPHLMWALLFFVVNALYIPLLEEPLLERRFGAAYVEYRRHVPRLIPRLRPWDSDSDSVRRATGRL